MHAALLMTPVFGLHYFEITGSFLCNLQGFLLQWFTLSTGCWIFCLAWQFYLAVVWDKPQDFIRPLPTHMFAWLVPLATAVVPLAARQITPRGVWCWVTDGEGGLWQWVLFYIPILSFTIVMMFLWVSALVRVWQLLKKQKTRFYFVKNIVGGFIFFLSFAFQCAHRIFQSVHSPAPPNGTNYDYFLNNDVQITSTDSLSDFYWLMAHVLVMSVLGTVGFFTYSINSISLSVLRRTICACKSSRRDDYEDLEEMEDDGKVNGSLMTRDRTETSSV